ncbi:Slp family lipoprotein [Ectothiorhodospiraceae bacterium 2226]|nr:Slp family lipoprotein [Ectothiorhodospiraceae bacterium 2226]
MTPMRWLAMLGAALALVGCATAPPFDAETVDTAVTPRGALERLPEAEGQRVLWGGTIIETRNLQDATQIEILAYPLNERQRPDTNANPLGRFLAVQPGYLERVEYAAGRHISVLGPLKEKAEGRIGEAEYVYPVVSIEQLELWPVPGPPRDTQPRFHFGVGVGIHR